MNNNQLICFKYFRDNLNWDDYMCAALVGCMMAESKLNPKFIFKKDDNIFEGLIGWKTDDRKEKALSIGLNLNYQQCQQVLQNKGVKGLSLESQLQMIVSEISKGIFKNNFNIVMSKCETLKDAVATVYCRYINGFSSKTSIPSQSDIKRLNKNNEFEIRLKYAEQVLDNYHHSIDI